MKKILILLVSLLVIISIVYFWQQSDPTPQKKKEAFQEPAQEIVATNDMSDSTEESISKLEDSTSKSTDSLSDSLSLRDCIEQVDQQYPGKSLELYKATAELYADSEMAAGISPYQTMPTASLKSLAEANDVKALFVLGRETMWLATTGLMINEHSDLPKLSGKERNEIAKNHKLDFELLEEGEEYLFRAATLGKIGGVGEFSSLASLGIKRLSEDADEKKVQELIAKILAYSELTREIHREDGYLLEIMESQLESVEQRAFAPFTEREDFAAFKSNIQEKADYEFEELYLRWKERRNYHGLPVHPKFITGDLVEYSEAMEVCNKLVD